jgi:hypothetical protein
MPSRNDSAESPVNSGSTPMTTHVVQFSGGVGSFSAAQRIAVRYGTENLVLLFADTLVEDPDLYRFLIDSGRYFGIKPIVVTDGRKPFEVFWDQRFLGNSRLAPCSHILKQKPCRDWLEKHHDPADTILYIGIDWSEDHRIAAIDKGWDTWRTRYPMCDEPYLGKEQLIDAVRAAGFKPSQLYKDGFKHNNRNRPSRRARSRCGTTDDRPIRPRDSVTVDVGNERTPP